LNGVLLIVFGRAWLLATAPFEGPTDLVLAGLATAAPVVNAVALILDARRRPAERSPGDDEL
jgi:hypothetical protein